MLSGRIQDILRKAGFNINCLIIIVTTPSGRLEIFGVEEFLELIRFVRENPDSFGIILEQKWRNSKGKAATT